MQYELFNGGNAGRAHCSQATSVYTSVVNRVYLSFLDKYWYVVLCVLYTYWYVLAITERTYQKISKHQCYHYKILRLRTHCQLTISIKRQCNTHEMLRIAIVSAMTFASGATGKRRHLSVIPFPATADMSKLSISQAEYFALAHFASHCDIHSWHIERNWCHGAEIEAVSPSAFVVFDPALKYTCHNGTITDPCTGDMIDQGTDTAAISSGAVGSGSASAAWHGVVCSEVDPSTGKRKVEEIKLAANRLSCEIEPADLSPLVHLIELDLSSNELFGNIPPWLGNMSDIRTIFLENNHLSGTIHNDMVRGLDELRELDMSHNQLHGSLPVDIGHMQHLITLKVSNNSLDGPMPASFSNMAKLQRIKLDRNNFHGTLPDFSNGLTNLVTLDLSDNYFSGELPAYVGSAGMRLDGFSGLRDLILRNNSFNGTLPASIVNMTRLEHLDISDNKLTGLLPELPHKLDLPGAKVILGGAEQQFFCPFPAGALGHPAFEQADCTCMGGSFCPTNNSARDPVGAIDDTHCEYNCRACSPGQFSDLVAGFATTCDLCVAGRAATNGSVACDACEAGHVATTTGATKCDACEAGKRQVSADQACADCDAGKFTNVSAQTSCTTCPGGHVAGSASTNCDACAAGQHTNGTACTNCIPGHFSNTTGAHLTCIECAVGQQADLPGASACDACIPGRFASVQATVACANCGVGRFADDNGTVVCKACPNGHIADNQGAALCDACETGRHTNGSAITCSSCGEGRFADQAGTPLCSACPTGKNAAATGAAACKDCAAGRFADQLGTVTCKACLAGKFFASVGANAADACINCPKGKFGPSNAATDCTQCIPGQYAATGGNTICVNCTAGTYQPLLEGFLCLPCEKGHFASNAGAGDCLPCSPGQFSNKTGLQQCFACPAGRYTCNIGRQSCERQQPCLSEEVANTTAPPATTTPAPAGGLTGGQITLAATVTVTVTVTAVAYSNIGRGILTTQAPAAVGSGFAPPPADASTIRV